ncbi:MAG: Hpt domain-containing protein [Campylobacterota bacterium]|nr:Hpt domain-containing protein [Campylobacterota bacterium]
MGYNLDLQSIANELDFDLEDVEMLLEVFIESASEILEELNNAIQENDLNKIYQCAHAIKGSSSNLTLMEIANIAKEMEDQSKTGNNIDYSELYSKLKSFIDNIQK